MNDQNREFDFKSLVENFQGVRFLSYPKRGYIVWRKGTGDNVELLHIYSNERRKGFGTKLIRQMVSQLLKTPPYHTIFGFTRTGNLEAQSFYTSLGFVMSRVHGVYKDGEAFVFSQPFSQLVSRFNLV